MSELRVGKCTNKAEPSGEHNTWGGLFFGSLGVLLFFIRKKAKSSVGERKIKKATTEQNRRAGN